MAFCVFSTTLFNIKEQLAENKSSETLASHVDAILMASHLRNNVSQPLNHER